MGNCPSRQPQQPPVVVNDQNVTPAEPVPPAPPPPPPVPEAAAPAVPKKARRSSRQQRRKALTQLFERTLLKCPSTKKIHISGFCASARMPTAQMPPMTFCQDCASAYKFQDDATASLFLDDASCDEETEA